MRFNDFKWMIGLVLFLVGVGIVFGGIGIVSGASFDWNPTPPVIFNLTEDVFWTYDLNITTNENRVNFTYDTGAPDNFSLNILTGVMSFTPTLNELNLSNYFKIIIRNISEGSDEINMNIRFNVTEVNDPPIITGIPDQNISEDTDPTDNWINLSLYASDEETPDSGLTFYIQNQSNASYINCSIVNNYYINCTNPFPNWEGTSIIVVNVTDGNSWDNDTFVINVLAVNDGPFFNSSEPVINLTWSEDTINNSINLSISFYDVDSAILGYDFEAVNNITIEIDNSTGIVTVTPDGNFTGVRYTRFRAKDTDSYSDYSNNVTLNVTPVADPPYLHSIGVISTRISVELIYDVNATEVDGENISFFDNSSLFVINITSGVINFTGSMGDVGTHWINISVNDSTNLWASEVINFTVQNSTAPILDAIGNQSGNETDVFYLDVNATDAEGDTLYFFINTSLFSIASSTGIINFTINTTHRGLNYVNVSVNDTYGLLDSEVVLFNFSNMNDAPVLNVSISNQTWAEDTNSIPFYLTAHFSDADGDTLTYSATTIDSITTAINQTNGRVVFTPATDFYGVRYVIISASDGINTTLSNNVTLNVTAVDENVIVVTTTSSGGSSVISRKISVSIFPKEAMEISPNIEKTITMVINNTGDVNLKDVTLEVSSDIEDSVLTLSSTAIGSLNKKETKEFDLTISTDDIEPGSYKISFNVKSPTQKFSQVIDLYIDITGEGALSRIEFVKDFFKENPECLELNELVLNAERLLNAGKSNEANKLIETAIESCKDLVSIEQPLKEKVSILENKRLLYGGGFGSLFVILFLVSTGYFIREFKSPKKMLPREKWVFKTG